MIIRQERLHQIKEQNKKKQDNNKISTGIQLLYGTLKNQNKLLLNDLKETFDAHLPYNCDLQNDFIKPPYLTPKIISHRIERTMNII